MGGGVETLRYFNFLYVNLQRCLLRDKVWGWPLPDANCLIVMSAPHPQPLRFQCLIMTYERHCQPRFLCCYPLLVNSLEYFSICNMVTSYIVIVPRLRLILSSVCTYSKPGEKLHQLCMSVHYKRLENACETKKQKCEIYMYN